MAAKGQKFQNYELKYKIKLVKLYLKGEGGYRSLANQYGLKDAQQLRNWVKKYKNGELTKDEVDKRGKCTFIKKIFKSKEEEWEYLLLENEYLKKKLLSMGESENFIANLWSSRNLPQKKSK
jgi:transposase-like protein